MSDRQNAIYNEPRPARSKAASLDHLIGEPRARRSAWRFVLPVVSFGGTILTIGFVAWTNFGHLFLPPRYTFPVIFGERQGQTTGQAELSAMPGRIAATNLFNTGTAHGEGRKQAIAIEEMTGAQATQNARVQAETIRETARLQATAQCITQIRAAAAMRRAQCIGSGVAGGQCEARGDLIEQLESKCGSLDAASTPMNSGVEQ